MYLSDDLYKVIRTNLNYLEFDTYISLSCPRHPRLLV